jgi:hypothetical protein
MPNTKVDRLHVRWLTRVTGIKSDTEKYRVLQKELYNFESL